MEDAGDGDAGAGDACCEELFGVGKGIYLFHGGDSRGELEHRGEVLGLALEGQGFQAEQRDGDMAGEFKCACGVTVDTVNLDSLSDVWIGEDVSDFVRGAGANVKSNGTAVVESA